MNFESMLHAGTMSTNPATKNGRDPRERRDPRDMGAKSPSALSPTSFEGRLPAPTVSSQRDFSDHLSSSDELICDYDTSVSSLYSLLEASKWEMAITRCRTHPNEVRTWVVRHDKDTKEVRWTLLPIHAAVIFQSPTSVVEALMEKYPGGVSRVDDQGMLPLHLAFRHKQSDEDLMHLLLVQHPKGVNVGDNRGRTPLELGREALFSAKLMRIYARTCVAVSSQSLLGETSRSGLSAAKEYEKSLLAVKADFASQILRLNSVYEDRVAIVQTKHQTQLHEVQEEARVEKQNLVEVHHEEMQGLHDVVVASSQDYQSADQHQKLALEIEQLQSEVDRYRTQSERLSKTKATNFYGKDVKEKIVVIAQDQLNLQNLVERQQEELEAAQSMRVQLLRTLLQQEEDDAPNFTNSVNQIQHLMKATQLRIDKVAKKVTGDGEFAHNGDKYEEYAQVNEIQDDDISAITEG